VGVTAAVAAASTQAWEQWINQIANRDRVRRDDLFWVAEHRLAAFRPGNCDNLTFKIDYSSN
jgi:hypothetical protein